MAGSGACQPSRALVPSACCCPLPAVVQWQPKRLSRVDKSRSRSVSVDATAPRVSNAALGGDQ